ncbi:hypothetical protein OSTOST_10315, partial [Ostertagia ostertagi]
MVVLDLVERSELTDLEEKLRDANAELVQLRAASSDLEAKVQESENLKCVLFVSVHLLKASLIEYEERYEMCKRENQETVAQLERLSGEFERLKSGFADVREQNKEADVSGEVDRLRTALEQAKTDRDRLRADVDRFRSTVEGIDTELDMLRSSNRNLCQENEKMAAVIDRYTKSLNDAIQRSEMSLDDSDAQGSSSLSEVQSAAVDNLHRELREEVTMLQERNRLLSEESKLLAEVNAQMKKQEETDQKKTQLLEEKISLLEEHREELQTSLKALQEKVDDNQRNQNPPPQDNVDEVSALTAQLREALAANAEKTEECEKLRQQTDDLEKEVTILEKDRSLNTMSEELNRKQPEYVHPDSHLEQLECSSDHSKLAYSDELLTASTLETSDLAQQSFSAQEVDQEKEELSERIERLEEECTQLKEALANAGKQLSEKMSFVDTVTAENEQLRQLHSSVVQISRIFLRERESREKMSRELQRLKEHLLLVEETSTVEAVEAEKRETELREQIRRLQSTVAATDTDAAKTTQSMKNELSSLQERVVIAEESAVDWRSRYEAEKQDLEVQLEEARASSRQSAESYRIDDVTLRQLFLSYFTAAPDKRADIALLLASILQYPPEDVHK